MVLSLLPTPFLHPLPIQTLDFPPTLSGATSQDSLGATVPTSQTPAQAVGAQAQPQLPRHSGGRQREALGGSGGSGRPSWEGGWSCLSDLGAVWARESNWTGAPPPRPLTIHPRVNLFEVLI